MLHAFKQGPDAAAALIGNRPVTFYREDEFLVLGADTKLSLRLDAGFEPRDELVARRDRRHVDLVTSHAAIPAKGPRPYRRAPGRAIGLHPHTRSWMCRERRLWKRTVFDPCK
jgi:hypothetical protein